VNHISGLTAEAERARAELAEMIKQLGATVERMAQKAASIAANAKPATL